MTNNFEIVGIFPNPVYITKRESNIDPTEEKEIEDIVIDHSQTPRAMGHSRSINSYIFDTKLKNLKEFCEKHIKIYSNKIINSDEELDFYITQSWLNIIKPGEFQVIHNHSNSIISGVFYVSTVEEDHISFYDPNQNVRGLFQPKIKEYNAWNSPSFSLLIDPNLLLLWPSYLSHGVKPNEKATTDRISISFNVFARGKFGERENLNELFVK